MGFASEPGKPLQGGNSYKALTCCGLPDRAVLSIAQAEGRILITNDRDFGELVFRLRQPHQGVILLRLGDYAPLTLITQRVTDVLSRHADKLNQFLVVTPRAVRVRRSPR